MISLSKIRRALYKTARIAGDVQAVKRGRVAQRIYNRVVGNFAARIMRRLFK